MNAPKSLSKEGRNSQPQTGSVIRFDMKSDEAIRAVARRGYEIAKKLKDLGINFKRIIPAATDESVRKQFRLPPDSDLIVVEMSVNNKNEEQKQILIGETKDQLLTMEAARIIDEGPWKYDLSSQVYRFLVRFNTQTMIK